MDNCPETYRRLIFLPDGRHAVFELDISFVHIATIVQQRNLFGLEGHIFENFSCEKSIVDQDPAACSAFVTINTLH